VEIGKDRASTLKTKPDEKEKDSLKTENNKNETEL
jgi:hypothetical protein